ncbi:endonuclease/exonuclease/phosphatase family protein [Cryobacterium zhongshanensis]|uniref:Endonuclease/exonuclease/phosphatase domain-containing protein n=1 Tax=Cryobacterium zhongshanensis TaxID=2928153 RepID=A0AA41QXQ3_9MICO|nr:endonuclease/exonuclease/phosphatase family protein [Cryobacterium zhongshanensis]MCI4657856.1 hypothetical protein [Cryobacterium zhongshanensis]
MVIDGNDDRGIDVGLMTQLGFPIVEIRSHVDDLNEKGNPVFSRDCAEYTAELPAGQHLVVLVNHFTSTGYGKQSVSNATRKAQATRAAEIYQNVRERGNEWIVLVGDLNDTPDSDPLAPLLDGTDLMDISAHPLFTSDPKRPGTYSNGTKSGEIDYVLLSPALFQRVTGGGIFRKGAWGGVNGDLFEHYATMKNAAQAGSDHAAIYADVNLD